MSRRDEDIKVYPFRSFSELLERAKQAPEGFGARPDDFWSRNPAPDGQSKEGWSGSKTFDDAVRLAERGWPEGRQRIRKETVAHDIDLGRMHTDFEPVHDVAGEMVDIGRFLEGEPECMVALPDYHRQGRGNTVEILLNLTTCCNQCGSLTCFVENPPGSAVTLKGLAVMMLLHTLEDMGYMTELFGCIAVQRETMSRQRHMATFPIQRAGEIQDMDRLAFILMHPAAFRRIGLSIVEGVFGINHRNECEYGKAFNAPGGADIYIPSQSLGFRNFEEAKAWVEQNVRKWKEKATA